MAVLPDSEIRALGDQIITPFNKECVQPASYDLALHEDLLVPPAVRNAVTIDLRRNNPGDHMKPVRMHEDGFELRPGECILASTVEVVTCPRDLAARVEGKSSLGRLFLAVHVTAGFIDPGFSGQVTLEIVNHGPWAIILWPKMKIAQVNFTRLTEPCEKKYGSWGLGSHYQGQSGPTPAAQREE